MGVAVDDRQVSGEALLRHPEVAALVHLGRPVLHESGWIGGHLVCLEGGRGHGWTEGVVGHGDGQVVGAGLPVWRIGGQRDGVLVKLDGALVHLYLVCAG